MDGWVGVTRDRLRAMPSGEVASLAARMSVEAEFLDRLRGLDAFEMYAADPVNPADLRVVYSPERIFLTRDVAEALVREFDGHDVELGSIDSPIGRLDMATFRSGRAYGVVLLGQVSSGGSGAIYLLADTAGRVTDLTQHTAAALGPAT